MKRLRLIIKGLLKSRKKRITNIDIVFLVVFAKTVAAIIAAAVFGILY